MNFKKEILKLLKDYKVKEDMLEVPDSTFGDYAFPCFILAKKLKKAPNMIAEEILKKIKPNRYIKKIEAKGPYLNFFVNKDILAENTLKVIFKNKDYGSYPNKKKTYMVEYFHANTHKGVHIGHIRNISLAEALCKILEKDGYKVIRANYQGDIGPHVAKCIWGYLNLKQKEPKEKKGVWLGKVYALASKKAEKNKKVEEEIREINNKLYAKDKSLVKIWKKTRQYCLNDFNDFYKEFGVRFDKLYFESEVEEPGKKIAKDMLKKGIAKESEGAIIVNLKRYNLGIYVLLTKEGNALYHAKDLGLAKIKQKDFKFDKCIHVTGAEQTHYFKQLFKTFELIGSKMAAKSLHIPYGLVMLPEGKMSSRAGTMVLFDELKEKIFKAAEKATKEKHKGLSEKELKERTKKIAYGALKFSMINRENNKELLFDWKRALDFEGETGPYVQYTYARISSILRKYNKKVSNKINFSLFNEYEKQIIRKLNDYPDIIKKAAESFKPNFLCNYLISLCSIFNEYYHKYPVLKADEDVKKARLLLIYCIKRVIANGLYLLGIEAPERM